MSFRLIKQIGVITAATTADDEAHATSAFTIGQKSSIRVTEVNGQDAYIKISNEGTAVTNSSGVSNGLVLKANSTVVIVPDEKIKAAAVLSATVANPAVLTVQAPGHPGFVAGEQVSLVGAAVAAWNTLITDSNIASLTDTTITTDKNSASTAAYTGGGTLVTCFKLSVINETAGADCALVIEEITAANIGV